MQFESYALTEKLPSSPLANVGLMEAFVLL